MNHLVIALVMSLSAHATDEDYKLFSFIYPASAEEARQTSRCASEKTTEVDEAVRKAATGGAFQATISRECTFCEQKSLAGRGFEVSSKKKGDFIYFEYGAEELVSSSYCLIKWDREPKRPSSWPKGRAWGKKG